MATRIIIFKRKLARECPSRRHCSNCHLMRQTRHALNRMRGFIQRLADMPPGNHIAAEARALLRELGEG